MWRRSRQISESPNCMWAIRAPVELFNFLRHFVSNRERKSHHRNGCDFLCRNFIPFRFVFFSFQAETMRTDWPFKWAYEFPYTFPCLNCSRPQFLNGPKTFSTWNAKCFRLFHIFSRARITETIIAASISLTMTELLFINLWRKPIRPYVTDLTRCTTFTLLLKMVRKRFPAHKIISHA